jgi:hypothetical protein
MTIERFPTVEDPQNDVNNAILLFGRRFHPDQTVVEHLAEFLLSFASEKVLDGSQVGSGFPKVPVDVGELSYRTETGLPLKFFSFFPISKLETRHRVHQKLFAKEMEQVSSDVKCKSRQDAEQFLKSLQCLLSGFVGVAGSRTWCAHTFLPITRSLLFSEVMWKHSSAREKTGDVSELSKYFNLSAHSFMARGGESLYLQLLHLFSLDQSDIREVFPADGYEHVLSQFGNLEVDLSRGLNSYLDDLDRMLQPLVRFVKDQFSEIDKVGSSGNLNRFGWIPKETTVEAALFAWELRNICDAQIAAIERAELLQTLCSLHVLRTHCFQAIRHHPKIFSPPGFVGGYSWVPAPIGEANPEIRKLSIQNYERMHQCLLYAVTRPDYVNRTDSKDRAADSEKNGPGLLRRIGKSLGVVVPPTGSPIRFTLPPHVVRCLVPALVPPGTRMRLDAFIERVYLHFGIALSPGQLIQAQRWTDPDIPAKLSWAQPDWFIRSLMSAGFLFPLSDAVSIVENPFK